MADKKRFPKDGWIIYIAPALLPVFVWFMWVYGLEIVFKIIMSFWQFVWDFVFGSGGAEWNDYDPFNDFK